MTRIMRRMAGLELAYAARAAAPTNAVTRDWFRCALGLVSGGNVIGRISD